MIKPNKTTYMKPSKSINRSLLALTACALTPLAAQASLITVSNPSFETGDFTSWSDASNQWGVISGTYDNLSPTDGVYLFYANGPGTISQTLTATLQPNTTYTLSMDVGHRSGFDQKPYSISLWGGPTSIASASGDQNTIPEGWTSVTATYTTGATVTPDQALGIWISGDGQQTMFDNVQLNAQLTAVPEPGSLLALGCLIGSGALLRSRRR